MYETIALKSLTSFRIGGKASVLFVKEEKDVILSCENAFILGRGTNILAGEKISCPIVAVRLDGIEFDGESVIARSGTPLPRLALEAQRRGLSGLEWACGIPASVGGAVKMNAGAFGKSIASVIDSVTVYKNGLTTVLGRDDCGFRYRGSEIDGVVLSARILLKRDNATDVYARMRENTLARLKTQPSGASAGCVYRNGERPAGWYIENCGLKGERVGDAVVSTRHANFIVNEGNATAKDVVTLMERIEKRVYEQYGVNLKREIKLLGEI